MVILLLLPSPEDCIFLFFRALLATESSLALFDTDTSSIELPGAPLFAFPVPFKFARKLSTALGGAIAPDDDGEEEEESGSGIIEPLL